MQSCDASRSPWGPSLRSAVFQQVSGLAITSASAWRTIKTMEEEEERRERRRRQRQQVVNCCKRLAAFLFSHIGLAAMVVAYSIMGGFLFQAIEAPAEQMQKLEVIAKKEEMIRNILEDIVSACQPPDTSGMSLNESKIQRLNETLRKSFGEFQEEVKTAVKDMGWDGNDDTDQSKLQWSLAGAILYAVTVITTIGYGHIAPKTRVGRMLTILYALIGIPLTFLYLSNIGNFLADCFRLFYKRICCDILCCQKCERKRKRERLKLRRRRELAAQRNILIGIHSEMMSRLPAEANDDYDDDGFDKERFAASPLRSTDLTDSTETPEGDKTQDEDASGHAASHPVETFPPTTPSPSSVRSNRTDKEEDERTGTGSTVSSTESDETVRETAIIDDENCFESDDAALRETAILEDGDYSSAAESSRRSRLRTRTRPEVVTSRACAGVRRTPSFHDDGFHFLEAAKETDILRDSVIVDADDDSNLFRLSRIRKRSQRFQSDPFLHAPSHHDDAELNRSPVKVRTRVPTRSFTVKPRRFASKNRHAPEFRRQGNSVPVRSDSRRCASAERWRSLVVKKGVAVAPGSKGHQKEDVVEDRAKANWKKLIEYTKQLAEKEGRLVKQGSGKVKKKGESKPSSSENKQKHLHVNIPKPSQRNDDFKSKRETADCARWGESSRTSGAVPDFRLTPPNRKRKQPFHRSDESFVTAASVSAESEDDVSEERDGDDDHRFRGNHLVKQRPASLDTIAIDMDSPRPNDDPEISDFQEFIQEPPISFLDDPFDYEEEEEQEGKVTVPISICLIIISGYLFAGSALFAVWEKWDIVTGSYFCFITLSTIGFGDIVPGTDMKEWASEAKLVLCALWLAFGLSLLAMCFNLMQEEVKDKCKWIGQKLGLLKDEGQS